MDDGWKLVEVEPETIAVNGNGANGNGHHDPFDIVPTVELVPVNGRHANGNGNGHHDDEAPEPQQSLFSWAEFMAEEPVKPRGRKTQDPSLSLFEWAVEQEAGRKSRSARDARPLRKEGGRRRECARRRLPLASDVCGPFLRFGSTPHVCGPFLLPGIREPPFSAFENGEQD